MKALGGAVYRWVHRSALAPVLSAVPVPVRFHDGRTRIAPLALWRLHRIWRGIADLRRESDRVYAAYTGGDALDIGAFEGWYSVLLAPKAGAGTVVSLEPDPVAYRELQTTLAMLTRVFQEPAFLPIRVPVGDGEPATVSDPGSGHPRYGARGGNREAEAPTQQMTVTADQLVEALRLTPTFVKIDVEGAELSVLRGMQHTLSAHRPTVMLELHPRWLPEGADADDVERLLRIHGYTPDVVESAEVIRCLWTPPAQSRRARR